MKYRPEEIGKRIAARRKALKMTQPDIAKKLNFSVKQISMYESGKATPPINTLLKLCDVLDCEFGYIMGDPDYSKPTKIESEIYAKTGLNSEALDSLGVITFLERKYSYWGDFPCDSINAINRLISSPYFSDLIENLVAVDRHYSIPDSKIKEYEDRFGEGSFVRAEQLDFELSQLSPEDDIPEMSGEQYREVEAVRPLLDELRNNERDLKIARFELQESFSLLVNAYYPKRESRIEY